MSVAIVCVFILGCTVAAFGNRDPISPAKLLGINIFVFYAAAIGPSVSENVRSIVLILTTAFVIISIIDVTNKRGRRHSDRSEILGLKKLQLHRDFGTGLVLLIWAMTSLSVFSTIYMIDTSGGLASYINSIGLRVVDWRGLGPVRVFSEMAPTLTVVYFAIGLVRARGRLWWALFSLHLLFSLSAASLSGSRTGVLVIFVFMAFAYHYLKHRIGYFMLGSGAGLLVLLAAIAGAARDNLKFEYGSLTTGLAQTENMIDFTSVQTGVLPLILIDEQGVSNPALGATFLTVFTNPVPRFFWPDKPETGGVIFTKVYTNDAWSGYSNLAPGLISESMMNFGMFGLPFFFFFFIGVMYFIIMRYRRTVRRIKYGADYLDALSVCQYIFILWAGVALLTGEFTNTVQSLIITRLLPILFIEYFYRFFLARAPASRHAATARDRY